MSWIEVADDVFCMRYEPLDQTIGAIRTGEGLVVIDSRSHRVHAEELLDHLSLLDPHGPSTLINTHHHWDHTFGNAQFVDGPIIGHERARRRLVDDGAEMIRALVDADWVPAEMSRLIGEVEITPPTLTFTDRLTLHIGDRPIDLRYLGMGHTDNDIVIIVDGVVFAGDLIEVGGPPAFGDSYPRAWVDTLGTVASLCNGPVVPGHGDVVDRAFVEQQRDDIARAVAGETIYPAETMADIEDRLAVEPGLGGS